MSVDVVSPDWSVTLPDNEVVSVVDVPDWDFLLVHSFDGPLGLPGGLSAPSVIEVLPSGASGSSWFERPLDRVVERLKVLGVPLGCDEALLPRSPTVRVWVAGIDAFSELGCPVCGLRCSCPHLHTKYFGTYGLFHIFEVTETGKFDRLAGGLWRQVS